MARQRTPDEIRIDYRLVGTWHTFTSPDVPGLHVGHPDLRTAFEMVPGALALLAQAEEAVDIGFEPAVTFEQFETGLRADVDSADRLLAPAFVARPGPRHASA